MTIKSLLLGAVATVALALPGFAQDVTIRVAYENNPGEPVDQVVQHWIKLVDEASEGKVKLEAYPSSQLGAKQDVIEQGMLGVNVITIADAAFLTEYEPDLGILMAPYLAETPQELFKIYESDWFKEKEKSLQEQGIHIVISNYLYGTRQLLTKTKVESPADLAGLKIRTPNNNIQIRTIEALGGTPTPMPLGDVYPALTQGVIDGVENPIAVLFGQKLYEPAKELSMIDYVHTTALWLGGQAYFDTLDPAVVEMLHETGYQAGLFSQDLAAQADARMLEDMKAAGVNVTTPDLAPFKEKAMAVYGAFPEWTPGLYDTIQAQLGK